MQADIQHARVIIKHLARPVPVVVVDVKDRHLRLLPLLEVLRSDRRVREEAVAAADGRAGVVAGRAADGESPGEGGRGEEEVGGFEADAAGGEGGGIGVGCDGGEQVE